MNYKYTSINPILDRKLYMYSSFEGVSFINSYINSRNNDIDILSNRLEKNKYLTTKIKKIKYLSSSNLISHLVDLNSKLINLRLSKITIEQYTFSKIVLQINQLFKNLQKEKDMDRAVLNKIIKKFEVKKSLPILDKETLNDAGLKETEELYHLVFALILIKTFFLSMKSLKLFNTLLKLNDLQIYRFYNEKFFNIDILMYSLIMEIELFKNIKIKFLGN